MRPAILAFFSLQILLPQCLAGKASPSRPSENTFAAAAAAGAFAADCLELAEAGRSSAEPLSLLQTAGAAHRQSAARGKKINPQKIDQEDPGHPQPRDPGHESVVAKSPSQIQPTGLSNESLVAKVGKDAQLFQTVGHGNESVLPFIEVGAESERSAHLVLQAASEVHGHASEISHASVAVSHSSEEIVTRYLAKDRQEVQPKGAGSIDSTKKADLKIGMAQLQAGVRSAASSSSDMVEADGLADADGISSTSAFVMLFLVFLLVVFCGLYVVTTELRLELHAPAPSMLATDPGKLAALRSPETIPQSVQRLPPTSSRLKLEAPTPGGFSTSPYRDTSFDMGSIIPETESELPKLYPSLVMPVARTRLAIPVEPLADDSFEVDVLGISGVPLLCAALAAGSDGMPEVQISLNSAGMLLAVVKSSLQLLNAQGTLFGTLARSGDAGDRFTLRDPRGRSLLTLLPGDDAGEVKMISQIGARQVERASMIRRAPGGRLPAEHYEIVVSPGVDAVLVLACFLALVVLALPGRGR
mmetsp:Transcript_114471/g.296591  ORF Transcript_114471/g.296591 Transcript_114471/m.296591 type:complete len:530 (+) Transcript_114471:82-1671(+)